MARYFLDSSALVKRYHRETGSTDVDALFNAAGNRFFVSRLALVEVQSSLARLVRDQVLQRSDFADLVARLEADVAARMLTIVAVTSRRLEEAAIVVGTHGLTHNLRTLDAIHLATALSLNSRSRLAAFVAGDKKLLAAAGGPCGLSILEVG